MKTVLFICLMAVLLSGCSDENQGYTSALPSTGQDDEGTSHPWETQVGFKNKARAVEGVLQAAAEERQAAMEEME